MHDLSDELNSLPAGQIPEAARSQALLLEGRRVFSVRRELLVLLYVAVALLVGGVGLLVKANLERIGPAALLTGIFAAAALCYAVALRARHARRNRSLGEDYVLLLAALLFSAAVGYAEVRFHLLGADWSRHLLLLAAWHWGTAYLFRSRLVLSVALTAFASWLGVEARLGALRDPLHPLLGIGPRSLLCALLLHAGGRLHGNERAAAGSGFREVYRHFAVNFAFWGALALGAATATRWIGMLVLATLGAVVGRAGMTERRESLLLYAIGYCTVGLVWMESLMLRNYVLTSWAGLATVAGAVAILFSLRARLRQAAP